MIFYSTRMVLTPISIIFFALKNYIDNIFQIVYNERMIFAKARYVNMGVIWVILRLEFFRH